MHKRVVLAGGRGFSLVELVVAIGVFILFAVGIYGGIEFVFKAVYQSRLRIIETGILNEQIEIIRNLPFQDVGIVGGSPSGILARTVTTTRNGIDFTITRTIRNIDDPFDGQAGGGGGGGGGAQCQQGKIEVCHSGNTLCISENALQGHLGHGDTEGACGSGGQTDDNQPADYKLVEVDIICDTCGQREPARMSTYVGPKYLEGSPYNGALFIHVFDSTAEPVQGATVHVVATTTSSTVDLTDTTDNAGDLDIVDLPAGIAAYYITVTRSEYTSDQTRYANAEVTNPVKPLASVIAQDVTSLVFEIDESSELNIDTLNSNCQGQPNRSVDIVGSKRIGIDPDVFLVSTTITTNNQGRYEWSDLVWDTYALRPLDRDLLGSIPTLPITVGAGVTQELDLILGPDRNYSLLVTVLDSVTKQPLTDAVVTVTSTGFSETQTTGFGSITQTDWSGGGGQLLFDDTSRYFTQNGNIEAVVDPGDLKLSTVGANYVGFGELESSILDLGTSANPSQIVIRPASQPPQTGSGSMRFQLASSNTSTPSSWDYLGPDGTAGSYYDSSTPVINSVHNGDRYLKYKAYLSTASTTFTPTLSDVSFSYTSSCTPPGQVYFGPLNNTTYGVQIIKSGYQEKNESVEVTGDAMMIAEMTSS